MGRGATSIFRRRVARHIVFAGLTACEHLSGRQKALRRMVFRQRADDDGKIGLGRTPNAGRVPAGLLVSSTVSCTLR